MGQERAQLEAFVATVMLAAALRELPSDERAPLVSAVCDRLPEPAIDFVRLQIEAKRAPDPAFAGRDPASAVC